jgi:Family of unknown function (DUF5641)
MVTKAIHLELVTGLTSEAFLAAFRRFTSRRGHCKHVYSDNGTNFVGAQKILAQEYEQAVKDATRYAAEALIETGTRWHFIPPRTPHFGGLWEAAVKSVKKHLKKVLADKLLSYEEFSTLLCRIEACLNSRPLSALTSDPNDLEALTPGHFLIGRAITAPPVPAANIIPHKRWDLLKDMSNNIWDRWQTDYLGNLVIRGKWNVQKPNLKVGELIMVRDKTLSPLIWPLGRIVKLYHGPDDLVRVVDVNTGGDKPKRVSLDNICKLPEADVDKTEATEPTAKGTAHTVTQLTNTRKRAAHKVTRPIEPSDRIRTPPRVWLRRPASEDVRTLADKLRNSNEGNSAPQGQAKRRRLSPWQKVGLYSTIVLGLCMLQMPQTHADKNITVFYPEAGFYVEELGEIVINRGQVRLDI